MQLDDFSGWLQHRVNVCAQGVWFDACPIGLNILVEAVDDIVLFVVNVISDFAFAQNAAQTWQIHYQSNCVRSHEAMSADRASIYSHSDVAVIHFINRENDFVPLHPFNIT